MFEGMFVDKRLDRRGQQIIESMVSRESAVIHQCCSTHTSQAGAYRFFGNADVTPQEVISASARRCSQVVAGRHVLAIHDTSSVDFQAHAGRLTVTDPDIGPLEGKSGVGFFLHPTLVIDAEHAFPLGYSDITVWNRRWDQPTKASRVYKQQAFEEKESLRWLQSVEASRPYLKAAAHVTVIADRESDIYDVFAGAPDEQTDVLIRVAQNRRVESESGRLFTTLLESPVQATYCLDVRGSETRQARTATVAVRWRPVSLLRPKTADKGLPERVAVWALEAREQAGSVPVGEEPILWRLLTTHAITTRKEALQLLSWYSWRWLIEEVFRVLKRQGLNVEASQLETGAALKKLSLMALEAVLPILQLTLERDGDYGVSASLVFSDEEQACQAALCPTLEGKTEKQQNPFSVNSLAWSAWIIGRLGGWKGYRSQSPPGYITMKRGLERFALYFAGWQLAQPPPKPLRL